MSTTMAKRSFAVLKIRTAVCRSRVRRSSLSVRCRAPGYTGWWARTVRMWLRYQCSVLLERVRALHHPLHLPHLHPHSHQHSHPRCLLCTVLGRGRLVVRTVPRATPSLRLGEVQERSASSMMVRRMCVPVVWTIASHHQCAMRSSLSVECLVPRSIACLVMSAIVLLRWCCSVLLERVRALHRLQRLPQCRQQRHPHRCPPHRHPPAHQCHHHRRLLQLRPHLHLSLIHI